MRTSGGDDLQKNEHGCVCTPETSCAFHADHNPMRSFGTTPGQPYPVRNRTLDTAKMLIGGDRRETYGSAESNFTNTGKLWEQVLGVPVTATQVAMCMALVKISRLNNTPTHEDSWIDAVGYLALGAECALAPEVGHD